MEHFDLNKLTVIHNINPQDRKIIHKFLDTKVHKTSVHLSNLDSVQKSCIIKCTYCKAKTDFKIDEYQEQYHNRKKVYIKTCNRCNKEIGTHNSDLFILYSNNCILIGNILNGYCIKKTQITEIITEDAFLDAISRSKIIIVDNPDDECLHKHRIIKYCNYNV